MFYLKQQQQQQNRTILYALSCKLLFSLSNISWVSLPINSLLAFHHCNRLIINFPKRLLMDIWVVSSSFAITNSAANLLVHLSWCPCGRIFHRWIVIDVQARSIQNASWRMLRRWDLCSQKGTARQTSACSCFPPYGPDQGPHLHSQR